MARDLYAHICMKFIIASMMFLFGTQALSEDGGAMISTGTAYIKCMKTAAAKYSKSKETASDIALAAEGDCTEPLNAYKEAAIAYATLLHTSSPRKMADKAELDMKATGEEQGKKKKKKKKTCLL
eukprot:gnl/Spiro4/16921_TR9125_c0_g1_i2.p2 gnl/Spiro4/16921_TR9125_c0_g1~~gnl/Spiro4/16921_TR9125_c0_g1_i2.p2  ORF type:complete len:125 (+),score=12.05 gnl/Spiro4/16921_TR9125_c0_g1_i2:1277-1651(+)